MAQDIHRAQQAARAQADAEAKAGQKTVLAHHASIADARRKSKTRQPPTSTPARGTSELMPSQSVAQNNFAAPMPVTLRPLARPLELVIEPQSTDDIVEVASSHSSRAAKHPRSESATSHEHVAKVSKVGTQSVDSFIGDPEEDLRNVLSQYSRGRSGGRPLYPGQVSRSASRRGRGRSSTTESHRGWTPTNSI